MGSDTAVVLGYDSYGQAFLVRRDRYGCELVSRVFIGESSPVTFTSPDSMLMILQDTNYEDSDEDLSDWDF